jgi:predicted dehydrogenase
MFNALIVGCGRIAGCDLSAGLDTHAVALLADGHFNLAGCTDLSYEKSLIFSEKYKCEAFCDLDLALSKLGPDLVCICTPDHTHFHITESVLTAKSAPKVVFLEKPACSSEAEYNALLRLSHSSGTLVVVNHTRRFCSRHRLIRDLILSGELGKPLRINSIYYNGWRHNGTHVVDTLLYLLGEPILWEKLIRAIPSDHPTDPTLELEGRFIGSGAKLHINAVDESFYQLFEFDMFFSNARLQIEDFGNRIRLGRPIINGLGERVLELEDISYLSSNVTPMQHAVAMIACYLKDKKTEAIKYVTLNYLAPTLHSLAQASKLNT